MPQLFLRLSGCPLRCRYCDTPDSWTRGSELVVHDALAGPERLPNPLTMADLDQALRRVAQSHGVEVGGLTLSVTGGEPLVQVEFLDAWLPRWPGQVLLETAGLWPARVERLLPHLDYLSLDWKLPSTLDRGEELIEPESCATLLAASGVEGWIKIVVTDDIADAELEEALARLAKCATGMRVYLQPATPIPGGPAAPSAERLLNWTLRSAARPLDLRVLPQIHPVLGAR